MVKKKALVGRSFGVAVGARRHHGGFEGGFPDFASLHPGYDGYVAYIRGGGS
jgi:hypothetical protein